MASFVVLDACVRLLPGVMGKQESGADESFEGGLPEYPHYTRPREWRGQSVPPVLLDGDHAAIAAWRLGQQVERTRERRPDPLEPRPLGHAPTSPRHNGPATPCPCRPPTRAIAPHV